MEKSKKLVIRIDKLTADDLNSLDSQTADLIEAEKLSIAIPDGFVITHISYSSFLSQNHLSKKISDLLSTVHYDRADSLMQVATHIKKLIMDSPFPDDFVDQVSKQYKKLGEVFNDAQVELRESGEKADNLKNLLEAIKKNLGI